MGVPKNFFKKKLANGVTVILEKRDTGVVSASITNKFGAAYEESEEKGIAHFIEHLLFTGTETRKSEEISREIEKKGGILNAFTAHEVTSYWFKMPSEHLFSGFDILTDILKNTKFDAEKFDKEKKVILEEIKMYHDDPRSHAFEMLEKAMYEAPFGELIIGSKETVSGLDRDFVADYFKKKYSPENYFVIVVGDANFDELCDYFEKKFEKGDLDLKVKEIKKKNGDLVDERVDLDQAHFVFGVHAPKPDKEDYYVLEVLNSYLAGGMSSKLFLEIREKRGLAYAVSGRIDCEKNYSNYSIYVGTTKEAVDEVKGLILQGFADVDNMTEEELGEVKETLIGLKRVKGENSSSEMQELIFEELSMGAEEHYDFEEKVGNVKLEDVKRLARELIDQGYSTAAVVPK